MSSIKSKQSSGLVFKVDFEKAFDTINWSFIFHLLEKMKFHNKWSEWLSSIFYSSKVSVLVNGSPTKEFTPSRGFRQGDPLSPLLFNLVMEVLHVMFNKAEELGLFKGVSIGGGGAIISHLQYTDDIIIFLNNDTKSIEGVNSVLQSFFVLTGLRINFQKSKLFGFHEDNYDMNYWVSLLGCEVGGNDISYLGAEISSSPKYAKFWEPLVAKFWKKLATWKGKCINQAGKMVLLQATLDSMLVYWFSLFLMPKTVMNQIEKIRKRFFWGVNLVNDKETSKLHLLSWEKICKLKEAGGLGISSLKARNSALLFKWWWRCSEDRGKFWNVFL